MPSAPGARYSGNMEGTWAVQSSPHRLAEFLKRSWNEELKEGLWTKLRVPDRVLCPLQFTDRWSFHQENIWEFWVCGSLILQSLAHQHLQRCLAWFWTNWNKVLQPDMSDLRPDCQDPGFACSSALRYRTFETTILSTIWLMGTSSHELCQWSIVNQTALGYLAYQAGTCFQIFGGGGPDLVLNIEIMVRMDFFWTGLDV